MQAAFYDKTASLSVEILRLLNRADGRIEIIRQILDEIRDFTEIEAVAIRLSEGDDYPYYITKGFPPEFVIAEKYLCTRNDDGTLILDSGGNPCLDCMCGNVICGRFDPLLPFFTEQGSFWTNSTTELLASSSADDRQAHTRNRCNGEGYESVALIPLRSHDRIVGLLQMNDRRKGMFTPEMIEFFEGVGESIGILLDQKAKNEALEEARLDLETQVELRTRDLRETVRTLELTRERLNVSLKEKDVLIKEIYHRVKNNLQLISSMLKLQGSFAGDKRLNELLQESVNRIHVMGDIHRMLYQNESMSRVQFGSYLEKSLRYLTGIYGYSDRLLHTDIAHVDIDISVAIPCGLIINELVSNALKHAYEDREPGDIYISLHSDDKDFVELAIKDRGIGIPREIDHREAATFGLTIVNALVEQLEGSIDLDRSKGTAWTIRFKKEKT